MRNFQLQKNLTWTHFCDTRSSTIPARRGTLFLMVSGYQIWFSGLADVVEEPEKWRNW